jgi:hypothetical protein
VSDSYLSQPLSPLVVVLDMELFSSKSFSTIRMEFPSIDKMEFPSTAMMKLPLLLLVLGGTTAYYVARSIYRLYFHPLRKIPGPKLAAVSRAYEFYYDVIKGGTFLFEIEKMHEKYGSYETRNNANCDGADS